MAILEICAGSVESAIAARDGGAARIELCVALEIGGITPSAGLIAEARKVEGIVLNVIIRPRGGDFLYNEHEAACMEQDIRTCRQLGADGVVIGALTADGEIDTVLCKRLIAAADGMSVTFHRAFDMCRDAKKPLEVAEFLPEDRLLLETDCPYMAPVPNRGKRCTSDMIAFTAEKIAAGLHWQVCGIGFLTFFF